MLAAFLAVVIVVLLVLWVYYGREGYAVCSDCTDIGEPRGLINPYVWPYSSGECTAEIVRTGKAPFIHMSTPDHVELVGYGMD